MTDQWIVPGIILAAGIVLGWVLDRVVRVRLERWALGTPWKGDENILASLRGVTGLWVVLLALRISSLQAPISEYAQGVVGRWVTALLILSVTLALTRMTNRAFRMYTEVQAFKGSATVVPLLVRITLFTIAFLVILQTEGVSVAPVLTALGVGGLAVALALQDTLGNIFAGIHTLMAGQIRPGDYIRIDERNEGYVLDIGWRNTSLRSPPGNLVVVPNKRLGDSVVTNFSRPDPSVWAGMSVPVPYGVDLARIEAILREIAGQVAGAKLGVMPDIPPVVRVGGFLDSWVEMKVAFRLLAIESTDPVRHALFSAVHARFIAEGIPFARPTQIAFSGEKLGQKEPEPPAAPAPTAPTAPAPSSDA